MSRKPKQAWDATIHQVAQQCVCGDALCGPTLCSANEHARVQNKPASMFASNRQLRRRESAGCQVGQALVLATAQETFAQARWLWAPLCNVNALVVATSARFSAPVTAVSCTSELTCSDDAMIVSSEVRVGVLYPGFKHGLPP